MLISQVTPYNSYAVGESSPNRVAKSKQSSKTDELSAKKSYSVELSGAAMARSLKLQGYTVRMISIKMGLDLTTVNQYLGIVETTDKTTTKSKYVQPEAAYTEPKVITQGRNQLAQDLNQLATTQFRWSTLSNNWN
ncbi:MAG: hypothetical protein A2X82_15630 [Geobacteraceae bacterium GWC2_55_20]|nr:MAG: hypothetical protein A2X82_15630 [Geobacteraceae bacterium GWC2_55_20]OGU19027.1 MAG: hypothetical protein A2X85_02580 [Geobacteraceae bacterium GWF2_54_21]HBA73571.1 hypothetical protein [Geobacter sp.]HCE67953.1 hypothetical protein [Geobacter sp.]